MNITARATIPSKDAAPLLAAHLARLETAGYVTIEKTYRGKVPQTLVSLTDTGRSAFEIYRKQLTAFINHLSE